MTSVLPRARCVSLLLLSSSSEQVKQIHAHVITSTTLATHPPVLAQLIHCYFAHPVSTHYAHLLFTHCADRNAILRVIPPKDSLSLYFTHSDPITADACFCLLQACARLNASRQGKQVHARIVKTAHTSDIALQTTTIHFYARCRDIQSARQQFDEMPERSSVTWNAMMAGYSANGFPRHALYAFRDMLRDGAQRPTERTVMPLLSAASQLVDMPFGASVHAFIFKAIPFRRACAFIGTALVDMYSKCGSLGSAGSVFERMPYRNVLSWTAMLAGYAFHGEGRRALEMLDAMQKDGISPNAVTFTCLLSACCHAGLVEEGLRLFDDMQIRFGVAPGMQHYGCIVDLLGRAGRVEEAYGVVTRMPIEPDAIVWRILLAACRIHGHIQLGEEVGRALLWVEQTSTERGITKPSATCQDYIALSNVYASAERWEDVSSTRETMKSLGIPNKAGRTSF